MKESSNDWVSLVLSDFTNSLTENCQYFVIGSVALVSFLQNNKGFRPIKDIDIICSINDVDQLREKLNQKGYGQSTFINKKSLFYNKLIKIAKDKYLRYEKEGRSLEILVSDFGKNKDEIVTEIYPGIRLVFPSSELVESNFGKVKFNTVSPETLYCIYSFCDKTWGRFVKTGALKRKEDLNRLFSVIDDTRTREIANNIHIFIGKMRFKIPRFLIV